MFHHQHHHRFAGLTQNECFTIVNEKNEESIKINDLKQYLLQRHIEAH